MKTTQTKKIILLAALIGLSAVLALVKIPIPPLTTLAFDSLPGFVTAALLGPLAGGIVGAIGHLFTALYSGFPMGALSHLIIMGTMFITMFVFGWMYRRNWRIPAGIAALVLNGPVSLVPFIFILGWGIVVTLILSLTIAAAVNILLAMIIIPILQKAIDTQLFKKSKVPAK